MKSSYRVRVALSAILVLALLVAGCAGSPGGGREPVRVGALFDLTGATADVGVPHAEGVRAYVDHVNARGGVNGRPIQLVEIDYAYSVSKAVEAYRTFREQRVVAIIGYGFAGIPAFSFPYEEMPGKAEIEQYLKARNQSLDGKTQKFIQGWALARTMVEGIGRAGDNPTGEKIKAALETFRDFDQGGLGSSVTFTATDHAGAKRGRVYQVKAGKWQPITDWLQPKG
ncbi:MAG: ABC transporter substrate-binding protein [Chloroflexi bacterium]|nr:ABC transporter substrate-binding protein [Chloroflexota bacterium]